MGDVTCGRCYSAACYEAEPKLLLGKTQSVRGLRSSRQSCACRKALLDTKSGGYERLNGVLWFETGRGRTDLPIQDFCHSLFGECGAWNRPD